MGTLPQVEAVTSVRYEQLRTSLKGWMPWVGKGSLAVLDQGLFAGSNFLLNVLLARWLAPSGLRRFRSGLFGLPAAARTPQRDSHRAYAGLRSGQIP